MAAEQWEPLLPRESTHRLVLVGPACTGKSTFTALARALSDSLEDAPPAGPYVPTIGANYQQVQRVHRECRRTLRIWDLAGNPKYCHIANVYLRPDRQIDALLIFLDGTDSSARDAYGDDVGGFIPRLLEAGRQATMRGVVITKTDLAVTADQKQNVRRITQQANRLGLEVYQLDMAAADAAVQVGYVLDDVVDTIEARCPPEPEPELRPKLPPRTYAPVEEVFGPSSGCGGFSCVLL